MARAVLVALIVVCVLLGSSIGTAAPPPSSASGQLDNGSTDDIEMLGLDSSGRSDVTSQGVDVSTAVGIQRGAARSEIDRRALEIAFERADEEQDRRELLLQAATDVEIAIAALRSEQRDLRVDYAEGAIDTRAYSRGHVRASARAAELEVDLQQIQGYADQVPQLSMRSRLEALEVALTGAGGPVTERHRAAIVGEAAPFETYVAVSPNGRTLSTVSAGEYVREAYRSDLWTPDTITGIAFDEAVSRTNELYPVAFNSSRNIGRGVGEHGAGTYEISMDVREGDIVTYLDGDTRNVFFETRHFELAAIQPGPSVSTSDNGTRLLVNRTFDGGPLRVEVVDNATGAPADVAVLVDDTPYRTGPDGVVWALDPAGSTRVVAVGERGNVSTSVLPISPSLVDVDSVGG